MRGSGKALARVRECEKILCGFPAVKATLFCPQRLAENGAPGRSGLGLVCFVFYEK